VNASSVLAGNANCVFCPYQPQQREIQFMLDEVFRRG
jgi:hypothetical protein